MIYTEFNQQLKEFENRIFQQLDLNQIKIKQHWQIDHLCFRVANEVQYSRYKDFFGSFGRLLIESPVNGRLISTFILNEPVYFHDWRIDLLELPAPKPGKIVKTGFEHIEVVIDVPFANIQKEFSKCQFDESGLKKDFNQELEIQLDGCAIKFHHLSLQSVVHLESQRKILTAIHNLKILSEFKAYNPLIAGTFPLDLAHQESDVDIVMESDDLDYVSELLSRNYDQFKNFKKSMTTLNERPAVIISFQFQSTFFEVIVQSVSSVQQQAYRHFLIEERLLKLGGLIFRNRIRKLREDGLKTEPAFAEALGLSGDPYESILDLTKLSEAQLHDLLKSKKII